jgi:hypothetical protein
MNSSTSPPQFLGSYVASLKQSAKKRGRWAFFPSWVIVFFIGGSVAAYYIPSRFWSPPAEDMATAIYVGILTLNGLILVLSWNAFMRVHEIISDSTFGAYLYEKELLNGYLFYLKYVNVAQVISLITSAASLLVFLCDVGELFNRATFVFIVATSAYAIKTALSAVRVMHDLIWQKAIFDNYQIASRSDGTFVVRRDKVRTGS